MAQSTMILPFSYSDFCHTHLVQRRDDFLQALREEVEVDELIHIRLGLEDYGCCTRLDVAIASASVT